MYSFLLQGCQWLTGFGSRMVGVPLDLGTGAFKWPIYRYSSLPGLLGIDYLHIPIYDNLGLIQNPSSKLRWLNEKYDDESREAIQKALRRKEFGFAREEGTAGPHYLENFIV